MPKKKKKRRILKEHDDLYFHDDKVQRFFEENGDYMQDPDNGDYFIFQTGAISENSFSVGVEREDPPKDEHERAKLIARYWELKAAAAREEFEQFKSHCLGSGWGVKGVHSDAQKIEHLEKLRKAAQTAKRYYSAARKEVKESEPFWMKERRKADADEQARQRKFLDRIKTVKL